MYGPPAPTPYYLHMPIQMTASGISSAGNREINQMVMIDRHPNECPVCHVVIQPENVAPSWYAFDWLEVFYRCTNQKCLRSFVGFFKRAGITDNAPMFSYSQSLPISPKTVSFAAEIVAISPSFVSIYAQANSAEEHQLQEIAGPGYRKSLEFLLKDYAISLHSSKSEEIKKLELMKVIKMFLSGDSLPLVSSRAAWLGNDETHYERRWIGKDLADLKKLIDATVHFITMQRLVAELPTDMPDPSIKSVAPISAAS
jgi:hypothetical protein